MLPVVRLTGNLVNDPELRYTPSGAPVATFRLAATERKKGEDGKWTDGASTFLTVKVWRTLGENVAESLRKGDRVLVVGRLRQDDYQDRDGNKRTVFEVDADDVAPSLARAAVTIKRTNRTPTGSGEPDPWTTPDVPAF